MTAAAPTSPAAATVAVVGLAVMGANLARNLASRAGNVVAIQNRSPERAHALAAAHPEAGFVVAEDLPALAAALSRPRTAIVMVQAGAATDQVIDGLAAVFEPGDIIIDGGNAHYPDTIRRERALRERGLLFVGAGISGGEIGALTGPSIMPGGSAAAYETVGPILASIAARVDGSPCVTHVGSDGAGHFVKMVHNGIEYADMQLIGEAVDLLGSVGGLAPAEIGAIFAEWNDGELESYLIEITADILRHTDPRTGRPFVEVVLDQAGSKGTGVWTVQAALELGVPLGGIAEAVFARGLSARPGQRAAAAGLAGPPAPERPADLPAFVESVRRALTTAKIVAYSQGFDLIRAGAAEHGWAIDCGEIARIWRGGCIIRAAFLDRITAAYAEQPELVSLLAAPYFAAVAGEGQGALRAVVAAAAAAGTPAPAFSSSLATYDGLRAERLPAALIQAQRDFFGAHSYRRVDGPGVFHTEWSGDRSETRLTP